MFRLRQVPFVSPRLHSRAILRAKIKDMAANSLELVKLVRHEPLQYVSSVYFAHTPKGSLRNSLALLSKIIAQVQNKNKCRCFEKFGRAELAFI